MKFILVIDTEDYGIKVEVFNNKEEIISYLKSNNWEIVDEIELDDLEECTDTTAEFIACKVNCLGLNESAYLRVVE